MHEDVFISFPKYLICSIMTLFLKKKKLVSISELYAFIRNELFSTRLFY